MHWRNMRIHLIILILKIVLHTNGHPSNKEWNDSSNSIIPRIFEDIDLSLTDERGLNGVQIHEFETNSLEFAQKTDISMDTLIAEPSLAHNYNHSNNGINLNRTDNYLSQNNIKVEDFEKYKYPRHEQSREEYKSDTNDSGEDLYSGTFEYEIDTDESYFDSKEDRIGNKIYIESDASNKKEYFSEDSGVPAAGDDFHNKQSHIHSTKIENIVDKEAGEKSYGYIYDSAENEYEIRLNAEISVDINKGLENVPEGRINNTTERESYHSEKKGYVNNDIPEMDAGEGDNAKTLLIDSHENDNIDKLESWNKTYDTHDSEEKVYVNEYGAGPENAIDSDAEISVDIDKGFIDSKEEEHVVEDITGHTADTEIYNYKEKGHLNENRPEVDAGEDDNADKPLINSREIGNSVDDEVGYDTYEHRYDSKYTGYVKEVGDGVNDEFVDFNDDSLNESKDNVSKISETSFDSNEEDYVNEDRYGVDAGKWLGKSEADIKSEANIKSEENNILSKYSVDDTKNEDIEVALASDDVDDAGETYIPYEEKIYIGDYKVANYTEIVYTSSEGTNKVFENKADVGFNESKRIVSKKYPKEMANSTDYSDLSELHNSNFGEHNLNQDYDSHDHNVNHSYTGSIFHSKKYKNVIGDMHTVDFENKHYIEENFKNDTDYKSHEKFIDEFSNDTESLLDGIFDDYIYNREQNIKVPFVNDTASLLDGIFDDYIYNIDQNLKVPFENDTAALLDGILDDYIYDVPQIIKVPFVNYIPNSLIPDSMPMIIGYSMDEMLIDSAYERKLVSEEDREELKKLNDQYEENYYENLFTFLPKHKDKYTPNRVQALNSQENEMQAIPVLAIFRKRGLESDEIPEPLDSFLDKLTWTPYEPSLVDMVMSMGSLEGVSNLEYPNDNYISASLYTESSDEYLVPGNMEYGKDKSPKSNDASAQANPDDSLMLMYSIFNRFLYVNEH